MKTASSAKRRPRSVKFFRFCYALRSARKKKRSVLEWRLTSIGDDTKERFNSIEKNPKRVGASTQPCSTSLLI